MDWETELETKKVKYEKEEKLTGNTREAPMLACLEIAVGVEK